MLKSPNFCKQNGKSALLMGESSGIIHLQIKYGVQNHQKRQIFTTVERHPNNRGDTYNMITKFLIQLPGYHQSWFQI